MGFWCRITEGNVDVIRPLFKTYSPTVTVILVIITAKSKIFSTVADFNEIPPRVFIRRSIWYRNQLPGPGPLLPVLLCATVGKCSKQICPRYISLGFLVLKSLGGAADVICIEMQPNINYNGRNGRILHGPNRILSEWESSCWQTLVRTKALLVPSLPREHERLKFNILDFRCIRESEKS